MYTARISEHSDRNRQYETDGSADLLLRLLRNVQEHPKKEDKHKK